MTVEKTTLAAVRGDLHAAVVTLDDLRRLLMRAYDVIGAQHNETVRAHAEVEKWRNLATTKPMLMSRGDGMVPVTPEGLREVIDSEASALKRVAFLEAQIEALHKASRP